MSYNRPLLSQKRKAMKLETGDTCQFYQQKRAAREARDQKQLTVVPEASVPPASAPASTGRPHGKTPRLMPVEQVVKPLQSGLAVAV